MASSQSHGPPAAGGITVLTATSPQVANADSSSPSSIGVPQNSSSPKGQQQCLCSPTTHQGSFRCRFHRSTSAAYFKRSKSMPVHHNMPSLSSKSVEST